MKARWLNSYRRRAKYLLDAVGTNRIRKNFLQALPFWLASLLTGLVAVGYTRLFSLAESGLTFLQSWHPFLIFIISPVCFLLAYLVIHFFSPAANGSGIPQVMAAIELSNPRNESKIFRLLNFRVIVVKIASSLLLIAGGGAIGREGPTIQIAGSIFRIVERWIPKSWPKLSKQSFILTGAAAGLAAAFNTPLGGIVFAMEELSKIHIRFFRTALFSAVIIAGLTAQGLLGPYLYLGYPDVGTPGLLIFFAVSASSILAAIIGSYMCKAILWVRAWKRSFSVGKTVVFVCFAGLVMAAIAYFFDQSILGSGKEIMNEVLFSNQKDVAFKTVLVRVIGPIICFNTGAAGGIFAPALAAGAAVGASVSEIFHFAGSNANILILSGMVGFLTSVTRTPFTSAILVLEMTDRHSVIFHLMLAAMVANLVAILVEKHSLYEQLKKEFME